MTGLAVFASAGFVSSAAAFEGTPALLHAQPFAQEAPARPPRTIAAFAIDDRVITLSAYGRRARARMNGDVAGLREARAMGKVFDGAPQPALVTLELSVKF
jgi:hypothetical protein